MNKSKVSRKFFSNGAVALLLLCASTSPSALAATSSPLNASMQILPACRVVSASAVDFGGYTGAAVDRTMTVVTRCNKGSATGNIQIRMDCGQNGEVSGTVCNRRLKNIDDAFASSRLSYGVYTNNGYSVGLPNTGVVFPSTTANGYEFSLTLYPRLIANQFTAAYGNYSDEVNVSVVF